jgi:hypothetical protein
VKKRVLVLLNHNNRFSRFFKRHWERLDKIAAGHNISSKVFVTLVAVSFVLRWSIIGVGIASVTTLDTTTTRVFITLNRLVGFIVPAYVFVRGRGLKWYIYVAYGGLIAVSAFGAEYGIKFLAYIMTLF